MMNTVTYGRPNDPNNGRRGIFNDDGAEEGAESAQQSENSQSELSTASILDSVLGVGAHRGPCRFVEAAGPLYSMSVQRHTCA
jgi:hypothetical protein